MNMDTLSKRLTAIVILIAAAASTMLGAVNLPDETLQFKVLYKWGLINKTAGRATVSLRPLGNDKYRATLTGRSEPWADNFYKLRDTLHSTMTREGLYPIRYDKIAHENGKFSHDIVKFRRNGSTFSADCTRIRRNKDNKTSTSTTSLTAEGMTVDMLGVFYYIRTIDFNAMNPGQSKTINIFSGKKKEKLTITYHGTKTIDISGKKRDTLYITFTFTTDGRKSSDPIKAWISDDQRRIPLKLEGSLKVGKVQCIYTGG